MMNNNYRMNKIFTILFILLMLAFLAAACSNTPKTNTEETAKQPTLTIMTHDSFAASEEVVKDFEIQNNVKIQILKSGDAGTALNKAILSKGKPLADVLYGVDNTFLSRALDEDIFDSYQSPMLAEIPDTFKLDSSNRAIPVDYGDVCLNYDRNFFVDKNTSPPKNLNDLTLPEYKDLLVVEHPATSSPGLAFLFTTIGNYGEDGYLDYWRKLVSNGVLVVNNWETAYYTEFSGSSGKGSRPIVVSYSSSPAFEVIYADSPIDEPPTAAVTSPNTCYRQIEFVGILKGTKNMELAKKWVDFMLSPEFQSDMPLQMFVFPVNPSAQIDDAFIKYLKTPEQTVNLDPEEIKINREKWINNWAEVVLK